MWKSSSHKIGHEVIKQQTRVLIIGGWLINLLESHHATELGKNWVIIFNSYTK